MDIRKHPRFPVQFRSSFSSAKQLAGEGTTLNLSAGGCKIESDIRVQPGMDLALRVHLPDQEPPMEVKRAAVRWARGGQFGVEFLFIGTEEQERLRLFLKTLEKGSNP